MLLVLGAACAPPPTNWRAPAATEVAALAPHVHGAGPRGGFTASGRVHFESPDGSVDGALAVRVAPPDTAWLEVRTSALFDLVGARAEVALPGDGFVLVYQERGDALDRAAFAASAAADLSPDGSPAALVDVAMGRLPAAAGSGEDLARRLRVGGPADEPYFAIALPDGRGDLRVWVAGDDLARLEWWVGSELRLEVRYDRYRAVGAGRLPGRLQVRAPRARLRARLELEHFEPRQGFAPGDFDVGGVGNPAGDRGVSLG